jgi:hypothetical protein
MSKRRIWLVLVRGALPLIAVGMLLTTPTVAHAVITAACPDGSIVRAKKWIDVHCAGAVEVALDDATPVGSGVRARSIAWENFLRDQEAMRRAGQQALIDVGHVSNQPPAGLADRPRQTRTRDVSSLRPLTPEYSLALTSDERRDLGLLVDLSQRDTPAILEYIRDGATVAVLQIAYSRAFEAKLRAHQTGVGSLPAGPVLVFSLEPGHAADLATRLAFSQRGAGFRPSAGDPREFSWIHNGEAKTGVGTRRLGYIVLPAFYELSRPLVVFWGDAVVATTLRP